MNEDMSSSNSGKLVISVSTASDTKPIENAHVVISKRGVGGKEEIIKAMQTNAAGRTPTITLPTPPKSFSLSPNEPLPFSSYDIRVDYVGYYTVENLNVPVFSGIVSVQPVSLIPLPSGTYSGKTKVYLESEPADLQQGSPQGEEDA